LLLGALAKSAQIPLHTWLPDAMEGPTPVSALIHAATMVTAGVYLIARAHVLFVNAPDIQTLVALLGLLTLLMAGVVALVQTDIKRIIAYSTMSQIGYMFTAVGIGAYSAGMFHLLTHAFFKALLFLGAGIVIHALGGEQDVRKMGGLGAALPRTKWLMWIGTVALIGFWPLSKDAILASDLEKGGTTATIVWVGGLAGAFLTGIYATRLMRLTFYGERSRYATEHLHTDHGEAPWTMMMPVVILAVGTLLSGFLAISFGVNQTFADWLASAAPSIEPTTADDLVTTAIAWAVGGAGGLLVWRAYADPALLAGLKRPFGGAVTVAEHKFYWDELYDRIAYLPAAAIATAVYRFFERWVIWGTINLIAYVVGLVARGTADAQSGIVRQYATALVVALAEAVLGAIALIGFNTGGGIQYVQNTRWISDFGAGVPIRYHVGMSGLSLFMVLLSAVGIAAAIGAAMIAGRDRSRAYLALLLLLESALVLLFTAQELVLFYVGWEAMMIPLYVLMGQWGGEGRRRATFQFVVYTLVGSLLMLVAVAVLGVTAHTFELAALTAHPHESTWLFLAFAAAFCIKAPLFPLHGWLPSAYRESTPEVTALLSGVISKAGAYGL